MYEKRPPCSREQSLLHAFCVWKQITFSQKNGKAFEFTNRRGSAKLVAKKERKRQMEQKRGVLKRLFLSVLYLSAFTFGGGYVIVTLMKRKFVDELGWLEEEEMLDLVAIAQSSPGPVAVNGAIVVGFKLAGLPGALVCILAAVIPPFIIISVIAAAYEAFRDNAQVSLVLGGMQAGVGAVIASVVWDMAGGIVRKKQAGDIVILIVSFLAVYVLKINVVFVILACAALGLVRTILAERSGRG